MQEDRSSSREEFFASFLSESLENVHEIFSRTILKWLLSLLHEQWIESRRSLFRFKLSGSPFNLTDLLDIHQVHVFLSSLFNCFPDLLVIKFCLKCKVVCKVTNLIVVKMTNHFDHSFLPFIELGSVLTWIAWFKQFFGCCVHKNDRWEESISHKTLWSANILPMLISLLHSKVASWVNNLKWLVCWSLVSAFHFWWFNFIGIALKTSIFISLLGWLNHWFKSKQWLSFVLEILDQVVKFLRACSLQFT